MTASDYRGPDLEIFEKAENWIDYLARRIGPHLGGDVLEVGAGIGTLTKVMLPASRHTPIQVWTCLEPDPQQAARIAKKIETGDLPDRCQAETGVLTDLEPARRFDAIMYADVLEHIEDHKTEVDRAAGHLNPGGRLIVMAPAHQWLFSPLDEAAGHFRRYTHSTLAALSPKGTKLTQSNYLDCVGLFASLANRLLLRKGLPSARQVQIWDRGMIPLSRLCDPLFFFRFGKSILMVWEKRE